MTEPTPLERLERLQTIPPPPRYVTPFAGDVPQTDAGREHQATHDAIVAVTEAIKRRGSDPSSKEFWTIEDTKVVVDIARMLLAVSQPS